MNTKDYFKDIYTDFFNIETNKENSIMEEKKRNR